MSAILGTHYGLLFELEFQPQANDETKYGTLFEVLMKPACLWTHQTLELTEQFAVRHVLIVADELLDGRQDRAVLEGWRGGHEDAVDLPRRKIYPRWRNADDDSHARSAFAGYPWGGRRCPRGELGQTSSLVLGSVQRKVEKNRGMMG